MLFRNQYLATKWNCW